MKDKKNYIEEYYPNIINARIKKYTQNELAEKIGIQQQEISRYEQNKIKAPINYIIELAKACNVTIDYITGIEKEKKENLKEEEIELLRIWNSLSERQKGRLEQILIEMQIENENKKGAV